MIPDAIANRIIDEDVGPKFHAGDFAGGVQAGIARIIGLVNGEPLPPASQQSYRHSRGGDAGFPAMLFAFVIARGLFGSLSTMPRGGLIGVVVCVVGLIAGTPFVLALVGAFIAFFVGMLASSSGGFVGNSGTGGWGGGSSGGFGGGGFSGGGGGFSGGGASGGW